MARIFGTVLFLSVESVESVVFFVSQNVDE
ncbi:MAG: hypothetical protein ACI9X0_002058 [Kiritimatiellia bacterium]|jgi:hypothetical protein